MKFYFENEINKPCRQTATTATTTDLIDFNNKNSDQVRLHSRNRRVFWITK